MTQLDETGGEKEYRHVFESNFKEISQLSF